MGLFDSLQNLIGNAAEMAQTVAGEELGGLVDVPIVQDIQEQVTNVTDSAAEPLSAAGDQAQQAVDSITQHIQL